MLIKAIIVNRNLLTTLQNTIEFLKKEDRVNEIHILDNQSTYPPLLDYYKKAPVKVHYLKGNYGPQHAWDSKFTDIREDKVGFSLEINDLPDTEIGRAAKEHESKYWTVPHNHGWSADVDTTFALYAKGVRFTYDAVRLDRPYTIKHEPWYITKENITPEWRYYLDNITPVSTWGIRIKNGI